MIYNAALLDEKTKDFIITLEIWRDYSFGKASSWKKSTGIFEVCTEKKALWYREYLIDLLEELESLNHRIRLLN